MKKVLFSIAVVAALITASANAQSRSYPDTARCNVRYLNGVYGFHFDGSTPFAFLTVGITQFDGDGHLATTSLISVGGVTMPSNFKGTYSVNPDCTGSMRVTFDNGITSNLYISLVHGGDDVYAMFTDAGTTASGTFSRQ